VLRFNSFGSTMPRYFNALIAALAPEQRDRIEVVRVNYVHERNGGLTETEMLAYPALGALGGLKVLVLRDLSCMSEVEETVARHRLRRVSRKMSLEVEVVKIC
jgi:hypothetical protein